MGFEKVINSMLESMQMDKSLKKLVPSLERLLVHWRDPVRLLLMGEFNAGKSTVINTLLKDEVIATGIVPTTAIATYIRYAEKDTYIEVVYENGIVERQAVEQLARHTSERVKDGKQEREKIHHINLYIPNPILKNIVLIDTPGLDSPITNHNLQAFNAYEEADDSLWIFKYGAVGRNTEYNVLKKIKDDGLHPIGVVNMIDESNDDDIQPYLNFEFNKLNGRVRKLIGVSAFEAQEAYETKDEKLLEDSFFPQLVSIIEEIKYDKHSRKTKRFDQSFLKFWIQLNDALKELLDSEIYQETIQKVKNDLEGIKKENSIIIERLADEEIQMRNNNQQLISDISNTIYLGDWAKRGDFANLVEAILELREWKEFDESYSSLLEASQRLRQDTRQFKHNLLHEFGEKIGFSKLLSTPKNVLEKFRYQQTELLKREKDLNKQIKKTNTIYVHLLTEKNYIQEKVKDYYCELLEENDSTVMKKVEGEKAELIAVNLSSKRLLQGQIRKWGHLVNLQKQMIQVNQFVQDATIEGILMEELPHLKEESNIEKEISSLNEALTSLSKNDTQVSNIEIRFEMPSMLKRLDVVPHHFMRNIRPLVSAAAIAVVASAFLLFKEPIGNIATATSKLFSNEDAVMEDEDYSYEDEEAIYEEGDQLYEGLKPVQGDGRNSIGYIDVSTEEIHIYQSAASGYEATHFVLEAYTSWEVYSENDSYYEIQEGFWVEKEDAEHLFTANLQEYIQYETAGIATIYPNTDMGNEDILVFERANEESSKVGFLGDTSYEVLAFTENGWMQVGENAWVLYDNQSITLEQWSLNENLNMNMYYEPILRTEGTTSAFIPIFAENSRDSAVIGYLEDVSTIDIYQIPTSKWVNIGTNAWIEADKYLDIDWGFVPQEAGEPIGTLTVDTSALNVREFDYQESNLLGNLPKGTTVNVYEVSYSTGWYRIGTEGWVSEDPKYSTFNRYYEVSPTGESVIGSAEVLVDMHVRLNDLIESDSQGILKQGSIVDVYEISTATGWYRIGYDAWISNSGKVVTYENYELGGY